MNHRLRARLWVAGRVVLFVCLLACLLAGWLVGAGYWLLVTGWWVLAAGGPSVSASSTVTISFSSPQTPLIRPLCLVNVSGPRNN
jgi:hypothetical protein